MMNKVRLWLLVIIVLASLMGTTTPVLAHVEGEPRLEATVVGGNEFQVGQEQLGVLQIIVQNKGTFSGEMEDPADKVMAKGDLSPTGVTLVPPCTTAVGVTMTLKSGSPSIEIVSGAVAIGTLLRGMSTPQPLAFQLRVAKDARTGTYQLELELKYQYLEDVDWLNPPQEDSPYYEPRFEFDWGRKRETQEVSIKIVGTYFSVNDIKAEGIRAGATGIITATIENSGTVKATEVTTGIAPGGNFVPVDRGAFLGDLGGGESKVAEFKVTVSPEAIAQTSPLDIVIKYKDENDIPRQTLVTVGIPIGAAETDFLATSVEMEGIRAGATGIISVTLKNNAVAEAREVTAEIVPGGHFTPIDRRSFLGDISNGNSCTTEFKVSVSKEVIAKTSPLDILIKYKDEDNIPRQSLLTIGVPVKGELEFEIEPVRIAGKLTPGAETVIQIPIRNVSDYEVKDAIARINIVDPFSTAPFSTTDDTAYVGILQPGESGIARFKITVDDDAVPKAYALEVEVKYWDSLGDSYISEPMRAIVTVQPSSGPSVTTIILISLIAIAIVGIMSYIIRRRKESAPRG